MFTGIIETIGQIIEIKEEGTNKHFTVESAISNEFKIDQSVAHNGCCLTVVELEGNKHTVTAIKETLDKTNLGDWKVADIVNIERCMPAHGRFDGNIVQGHVDQTAESGTPVVLEPIIKPRIRGVHGPVLQRGFNTRVLRYSIDK